MKKMIAILLAALLCLSFSACEQAVVQEPKEPEVETRMPEVEAPADTALEAGPAPEVTEENTVPAAADMQIPMQLEFTKVEGLSDKYVDFENRAFAYNGKVFKLGESTLKDLIDGGVPFDEKDLNNRGNNVNSNYETDRYTVQINDYAAMQIRFINVTEKNLTEEECLLSHVRYYNLYVPQPDYDAERNAKIAACIMDASEKVGFSFPITLTKEQLLENSSEGAEADEYNNVKYRVASEVYYGSSGFDFEFNKATNQLDEVRISWLP